MYGYHARTLRRCGRLEPNGLLRVSIAIAVACLIVAGCGSSSQNSSNTVTITKTVAASSTVAPPTTTAPSAEFVTFGDGTYTVGSTVKAGTYRAPEPTSACYWERLAAFSGDPNDILANDNTSNPTVVTILPTDTGFTTQGCGTWTSDLSAITSSKTSFPAGTYIVNVDITSGTYSAPGGDSCYWARLAKFTGTPDAIIANDIPSGNTVVTIAPNDTGFESRGCGIFTAAGPPTAAVPVSPPAVTAAASPPTAQPKPNAAFSFCGGGVEARAGTTSCEFAQNVFYEFYEASPQRDFPVYSPVTGKEYQMHCTGESLVTCSGGTGAEVRFPMSAVRAYTESDARAYARSHDLGH
jgi:hypothetical protein